MQTKLFLQSRIEVHCLWIDMAHENILSTLAQIRPELLMRSHRAYFRELSSTCFHSGSRCCFGISQHMLEIAHSTLVESIFTFNITAWYSNLSVKSENQALHNITGKIIGKSQKQLCAIQRKAEHITNCRYLTTNALRSLNCSQFAIIQGPLGPVTTYTRNILFPHDIQALTTK